MAAFYVAQSLSLTTRNLTLSEGEFSFEAALELAWREIRSGARDEILVGGVDESCLKEDEHLPRIRLDEGQFSGEGSGWLFLSADSAGALGILESVKRSLDGEGWSEGLEESVARILPGMRLRDDQVRHLTAALEAEVDAYLPRCGAFLAASAFGIAELFDAPPERDQLVLHVGRSPRPETVVSSLRLLLRQGPWRSEP
jgi:hypothetical protein